MTPPATQTFEEHITSAFTQLRTALDRAIVATGVSASAPQELARRLGISRNLTWKISKVVCTPDLYQALQHLPGDEGIAILLKASERAGVEADVLARVRAAQSEFDRVVEVHTGDRATLDVILDNLGGAAHERLDQSRKLAFRGNSGIWGVQARVRSTTTFIAPSAGEPTMIDLAIVGGVVDFRRLRPGTRWPLLRPRQYHDDGTPIALGSNEEPIDIGAGGSPDPTMPMLIRPFCSANMPAIRAVRNRLGWDYELGDGPVGNLGAFTCFFGRLVRRAVVWHHTEQDPFLDLLSHVTMPVETMIFDVLVHQDLSFLMSPRVMLLASTDGVGPGVEAQSIPLEARAVELSGRPPMLGTQLIPRYEELVTTVLTRGGWRAEDFRALRLTIKYPPMHSVAVMRNVLPPHG